MLLQCGCRTYNGYDINAEEGTNPQIKDGRGNICPVTIILPTLAMEANKKTKTFMELLSKKIEEAKDMLIERYNYMLRCFDKGNEIIENERLSGVC